MLDDQHVRTDKPQSLIDRIDAGSIDRADRWAAIGIHARDRPGFDQQNCTDDRIRLDRCGGLLDCLAS